MLPVNQVTSTLSLVFLILFFCGLSNTVMVLWRYLLWGRCHFNVCLGVRYCHDPSLPVFGCEHREGQPDWHGSGRAQNFWNLISFIETNKACVVDTFLGTDVAPLPGNFEGDFPFPQAEYASCYFPVVEANASRRAGCSVGKFWRCV